MMAGLAAAQGNNGKCGVGVAFAAYITGTLPSDSVHVVVSNHRKFTIF